MGRAGVYAHRARPETRLIRPRRIAILGHVGTGNLGDEAIIAAVLQAVRERIPDAQITAFTVRPEDTRARHGIPAFPIRPGVTPMGPRQAAPAAPRSVPTTEALEARVRAALKRFPPLESLARAATGAARRAREASREAAFWVTRYRRLRGIDLVIVAGSNQLSDYVGGAWAFPYTVYSWSLAARWTGARVAFLSVGVGPIRRGLSRRFIRTALSWAAYRSYRDVGSREAVEALGIRGPHAVAPDLAHGLRFDPPTAPAPPRSAGARTAVINPLPYFDPRFWAESDAGVYARYVETVAALASWLIARGYRVHFAPTQLRADPPVIADVMEALRRGTRPGEGLDPPVERFEDLLALLGQADLVIATRFHGVVLAHMLGKPTLGIAYRRSTTDLMEDVGQGAYAVDIAKITVEGLAERVTALESDRGAAPRITARVAAYREALAAQYEAVLGAGPEPPGRAGAASGS